MPYVVTIPDHLVPASVKQRSKRAQKPAANARQKARKKNPNAWVQFCTDHMQDDRVQAVPPRQRFGVLSQMYKGKH